MDRSVIDVKGVGTSMQKHAKRLLTVIIVGLACTIAAGAAQEAVEEHLMEVDRLLQPLISALAGMGAADDSQPVAERIDPEALSRLIRQLDKLLEEDDAGAGDLLESLAAQLPGERYQGRLRELTQSVGEYDFEAAKNVLCELAGELDIGLN